MKATGIVRRIDDLGRVVVPKEIRRTVRIREGDPLEIFTDREGEIILKKYSPIGELSAFAKQYAESLSQVLECLVGICDMDQVVAAGDYKVLPVSVKDVDMNALRTLGDDLKDKIGSGVIILASDMGGKVNLIVTATDDAVKAGAHAGKIIKEAAALVGGGGGGRPNMAQAGGKNPAGIKAALEKAVEIAKEQL